MNNKSNNATEQLEGAFQSFNRFSEKLADSYGELENQVGLLTTELARAHSERLVQLEEKETLAKRLSGLLEVLPAGIVVLAADGCITQTNPIAREMLSLESDSSALNGQKWEIIAHDAFVSNGDELQLKDGRWVSVAACPLQDDPGKIILISDISETHHLQEVLNRQQRLSTLGETIASLAHQIRTPLSTALLYLSTMNHPMSDANRNRRYASKAQERLLHLECMVNDMLLFVRGDVSKSEHINVSEFFERLENAIQQHDMHQQIQLDIGNSLKNVVLRASGDILLSAIQNIIDNAIDACADLPDRQAKITISTRLNHHNQLEIKITDNGRGMSETTKAKIFEPFFTTRPKGIGLGLAVVNATVKRHGGNLNIVSSEGVGSEVTLTLPHVEADGMLPSSLPKAGSNVKFLSSHAAYTRHNRGAKLRLIDCQEV